MSTRDSPYAAPDATARGLNTWIAFWLRMLATGVNPSCINLCTEASLVHSSAQGLMCFSPSSV